MAGSSSHSMRACQKQNLSQTQEPKIRKELLCLLHHHYDSYLTKIKTTSTLALLARVISIFTFDLWFMDSEGHCHSRRLNETPET